MFVLTCFGGLCLKYEILPQNGIIGLQLVSEFVHLGTHVTRYHFGTQQVLANDLHNVSIRT